MLSVVYSIQTSRTSDVRLKFVYCYYIADNKESQVRKKKKKKKEKDEDKMSPNSNYDIEN